MPADYTPLSSNPLEALVPQEGAPQTEGQISTGEGEQQAPQVDPQVYQQQVAQQIQQMLYAQQMQQLAQQNEQMRQEKIGEYIRALPAHQREYAKELVAYNQYLQQTQGQYQQAVQYIQQLENAFLPVVKDTVFSKLSQQHKVEKEILAKFATSPKDAQTIIKVLAEFKKRNNFEQRQALGSDRVSGNSGQTNHQTQHPELVKQFKNTGKIRDYIRARQSAGTW